MPIRIGRLTSLRTLDEFHVSGGGGVDASKVGLNLLKTWTSSKYVAYVDWEM